MLFDILFLHFLLRSMLSAYRNVNLKLRKEEHSDISALLKTVLTTTSESSYPSSRESLAAHLQRSNSPPLSDTIQVASNPFVPVFPRSRRIDPINKPEDSVLKSLNNVSRQLLSVAEMDEVEDPIEVQNMLLVNCDGWRMSVS